MEIFTYGLKNVEELVEQFEKLEEKQLRSREPRARARGYNQIDGSPLKGEPRRADFRAWPSEGPASPRRATSSRSGGAFAENLQEPHRWKGSASHRRYRG